MIPWTTITSVGDLAVMAPAALAIMTWLFAAGERRLALWWAGLFSGGMAVVTATKIAFIGWGVGIHSLDFTGFSGHAMRAAAVIPVLAHVLMQKSSGTARVLAVSVGFACAALVAASRVEVHAHSLSEAALGFLLGTIVSAGFLWRATLASRCVLNRAHLGVGAVLMLVASCAGPAPTQRWLTEATLFLSGHDEPVKRTEWQSRHPRN